MWWTRPIFHPYSFFPSSKQIFDFSFILTTRPLFSSAYFSIGKSRERKADSLENWISFLLMLILFRSFSQKRYILIKSRSTSGRRLRTLLNSVYIVSNGFASVEILSSPQSRRKYFSRIRGASTRRLFDCIIKQWIHSTRSIYNKRVVRHNCKPVACNAIMVWKWSKFIAAACTRVAKPMRRETDRSVPRTNWCLARKT